MVEDVVDDLSAERLDARRGLAADHPLEVGFLQVAFEGVDAGEPNQGRMEEAGDDFEGTELGVAAAVGEAAQPVGQAVDFTGVLHELLELPAGLEDPRRQCDAALLPRGSLVAFHAAALVLAPAFSVTRLVAPQGMVGDRAGPGSVGFCAW